MSAQIVCITSGGGLPIFSRHKGNAENLPFPVIGSLNGVHMFGKSQKIELLNTLTEDYCVVWKEFHESVVLIGISSGCTKEVLAKTLNSIFNAIVLIVGLDEIKSQRNIERLKRELRICYPVIDRLLDSLDCGYFSNKHASDLVGMVETILCSENYMIQAVLDSFTDYVDSMFSCVLINGKIAAATDSWWSLNSDEIKLLSLLATVDNTATSKDIPVFLPHKSPTVAFRFISCTLIPDVQLCCLCGPTPVLDQIERMATQSFRASIDMLTMAAQCHPRNFPASCVIDSSILGLLLVNTSAGKYMISRNPQRESNTAKKSTGSNLHRLDILRTFFYHAVSDCLLSSNDAEEQINRQTDTSNVVKEIYWCSEYHKCYAVKLNENILCSLYSSGTPTHAMSLITDKTLRIIIGDKQICW